VAEDSRATWVLRYVMSNLPPSEPANGHLRVLDSWVDDDAVCLVYTGWWQDGPIGLRRVVEPDVPVEQIALYVLIAELGEPPGLLLTDAEPHADGIRWWEGHEPE
jgi:hypothetical protein